MWEDFLGSLFTIYYFILENFVKKRLIMQNFLYLLRHLKHFMGARQLLPSGIEPLVFTSSLRYPLCFHYLM